MHTYIGFKKEWDGRDMWESEGKDADKKTTETERNRCVVLTKYLVELYRLSNLSNCYCCCICWS